MTDENAKSFSKRLNEELRAGRGQVVDGYQMPEAHRAINNFLRKGVAKHTWETDAESGQVTHVEGEPVGDRGSGGVSG